MCQWPPMLTPLSVFQKGGQGPTLLWSEVKWKLLSRVQLFLTPMDCPWNSSGQNTGVGSLSLLQGIFLTRGSNPGLPYCRQNLYQLSHKGSPRILEWVAYPFSRGSSYPRIKLGPPALQVGSLPTELSGKPVTCNIHMHFPIAFMVCYCFLRFPGAQLVKNLLAM